MNKKNFMDMMICSLSAAIIILCFTYMEQSRGRDTLTAVCGMVFLAFLTLTGNLIADILYAVADPRVRVN